MGEDRVRNDGWVSLWMRSSGLRDRSGAIRCDAMRDVVMRCDGMRCAAREVLRALSLATSSRLLVYFRIEVWSKKQNEGCCCSHTKTAGQKREKGRAELCSTALFGHESYRINQSSKGLGDRWTFSSGGAGVNQGVEGGNAGELERGRWSVGCSEGCTCRSVVEVCKKVEVTDGGILGVLETETEGGTLDPL